MKYRHFLILSKKVLFTFLSILLAFSCADEQFLIPPSLDSLTLALNTNTTNLTMGDCSACTYVVPPKTGIIDGLALGLKPGDVIGLDANIAYGSITFRNINGTFENPIIIKNCGGVARMNGGTYGYTLKTQNSKYFRITGGNVHKSYGIVISGGNIGISLEKLSTDFEVDHIEIHNQGFAGIMAKTDPNCDDATIRENFLMKDVDIHNNYIHDTKGEGIYAGNSLFMGMNTACGVRLPHEIHYIRIFNNIVKNTGWDGIQLGAATKGASVHSNIIENYGIINNGGVHSNGIQIGAGTGGVCHNNLIKNGTGNGIIMMGLGDNIIYNNVIENTGIHGVFADERYTPGPGFKFLNNTIINPKGDGFRIYSELVPMNVIVNNIILNPGNYSKYVYPRKPEDAFIYKLGTSVRIDVANNYFAINNDSLKITSEYEVAVTCPIIDKGADISPYYSFRTDFNYKKRLKGAAYDIGAIEYH